MNLGVCYLRLDFEAFTLQGVGGTATEDEGICADSFTVTVIATKVSYQITELTVVRAISQSPSGQVVPEICGQNTGQHSKSCQVQWGVHCSYEQGYAES